MPARLNEAVVGSHLADGPFGGRLKLYYRRERDREVDHVVRGMAAGIAIAVTIVGPPRHGGCFALIITGRADDGQDVSAGLSS